MDKWNSMIKVPPRILTKIRRREERYRERRGKGPEVGTSSPCSTTGQMLGESFILKRHCLRAKNQDWFMHLWIFTCIQMKSALIVIVSIRPTVYPSVYLSTCSFLQR